MDDIKLQPQVIMKHPDGRELRFDTHFPEGWQKLIDERDQGKGPLAKLERK